jgi:hypothetical protein
MVQIPEHEIEQLKAEVSVERLTVLRRGTGVVVKLILRSMPMLTVSKSCRKVRVISTQNRTDYRLSLLDVRQYTERGKPDSRSVFPGLRKWNTCLFI